MRHGENQIIRIGEDSRIIGISPKTLYNWWAKYTFRRRPSTLRACGDEERQRSRKQLRSWNQYIKNCTNSSLYNPLAGNATPGHAY